MPVNFTSARDKSQLHAILRGIDISVPLRTEGRTTDHTETWVICRLLATLSESNLVSYPVSVLKSERPDFQIEFGATRVGLEVTEAVSEQYAEYSATAEREFPDALLEPGHFRWKSPKRSVHEMRLLLQQDQLSAEPLVGDRAEREWSEYIKSAIEAKRAKLAKPGFQLFPANWLAIYDNLPLGHINLEEAVSFLQPTISACWSATPAFAAVFIEHDQVIVMLSHADVRYLPLCDLR